MDSANDRPEWKVQELSSALGVEISGVDLSRPLAPGDDKVLVRLLNQHGLLLFRGQNLSGDDQLRVCSAVRPVSDPIAWISNVEAGFHPEGELLWHSDYMFTAHPMLGLSLYAIELGAGAAPTHFANTGRAVELLPKDVLAQLAELSVVQCIDALTGRDNVRTRLEDVGGSSASTEAYPRHSRAAIWPHPITGRPLLSVSAQQSSHFDGKSARESDELLDAAFTHLYRRDNVYVHDWQVGDFVVWDNLLLQHGRPANPNTVRRSLRRVAMNTVTTVEIIAHTGFNPAVRARLVATA